MGSIAATKYHEAMVESLGKEKEQEIRDLMLTKKSKEHPPEEGKILYTGKGEHVFLEPWTMTYFRSSYASIMKAYEDMKETIDSNCEETLTEWFFKLGLPKTYNSDVIDEVIDVDNDAAIRTGRQLAASEGLLVGISSGAAAYAATVLAKRPENKGKTIVALLPDTGERYLSTVLYAFEEYPL